MPRFRAFILAVMLVFGLAAEASAQTARIENTATLAFEAGGATRTIVSNTVTLQPGARIKRPTTVSFRQLPANFEFTGRMCVTSPRPTATLSPLTTAEFAATAPLVSHRPSDPLVIVLEAAGENRDPLVRETAQVIAAAGDAATQLVLMETDVNSGIFAGAVPAKGQFPDTVCDLRVTRSESEILVSFAEGEFSFGSIGALLVDPTGYVFDSRTGQPIDGATVTIIDDATGLPAAQVFAEDGDAYPNSVVTGGQAVDSRGDVLVFPPGNYRFPLLPVGNYRLLVTPPPGYTAPSVVPRASVAGFVGPEGPYTINDGSYGLAFALSDPNPVMIDIPIDPAASGAALVIEKTASVREASPGDFIQYRLRLNNRGGSAASGVAIADTLPQGMRYRTGSSRGAEEPQVVGNGRGLTFTVPSIAAGGTAQLSYVVEVTPGAPTGEAVNRARVTGATPSNEASASVLLKPLLFTDAMTIIGRVTEGDCRSPARGRKGVAGIRLLLENGTFVVTDRDGMYHIEGVRPGTHVVQIDTRSIPATHAPVACDSDTRQGRSAISRFVEGGGGSLQRVDFQLRPTGKAAAAAADLPITIADDAAAAGNRDDWLAAAAPGIDWLFPAMEHNPRAPAVRVVIRHKPGQSVALTINGVVNDPLLFDGSDIDEGRGVAISRWSGLPLKDGDNMLVARVLDPSGAVAATLTRTVHYANAAARVTYVAAQSRLVADGLTRPLVAVRVTDRDGKPVRAGTMVPFRVDQPYTAAQEVAAEQGRQLAGLERSLTTARVVGDDGLAFIALEPTMQPGAAHIVISLRNEGVDQVSEFKAWLSAGTQDWVVVGFAKGTVGFDLLRAGNEARGNGRRKAFSDGQTSFYAKGRIKGSWLMTIAYDSDRQQDRDRKLLGTIDPDRYYTVYGDGTRQGYDAATDRKLYLRLESREFYALFGDFETGMTDTKLARYSRTINGVKAEYHGKTVTFTGFAANDDQIYARDEIRGNGLSGPYRLSADGIVANSDKISIETRDRFRSEKIVESRQLTRHIDYDVDTAGTIRFREPILTRDSNLNPIFIVVDYETYGRSRKLIAGGRAATSLMGGRLELGTSVLHDETIASATVVAVDAKLRIAKNTIARVEAATGGRGGIGEGRAYRAELEHHGKTVDAVAYTHRQDRDFGLGQQNFAEAGTVKYGLDGRIRLLDRLSIVGSGWYQRDLDGAARRVAGETKLEYRRDHGTLFVSGQFASDRTIGGRDRDSRLIGIGATQNLLKERLTLSAQSQFALGGLDDSVDFPVRHVFEAGFRITPDIRLVAGQEIARGDRYTAHSTRIGFDLAPWSGARLLTTLNQQAIGENGPRTFAQYGLNQSVPIGKRWTIDATVDASNTLKGRVPTEDVLSPFQPVSSGTSIGGGGGRRDMDGDYKSATLGATYRGTLWSWNGRVEYRTSDRSDRWGVSSNLLRTLGAGKTIASGIQAYSMRETNGATTAHISADLAFAFRPIDSRWSLLERFELRQERADQGASTGNALAVPVFASGDQTTSRAINNLAVNYRTGDEGNLHGIEASLYYGAKYIRGRYADEVYQGFIDVIGLEVRKDLGPRFDLGFHGSIQHSWTSHTKAYSIGPSIGVSPARDSWFSVGYNVTGFRDRDFEEARYTRKGPYLTMRLKFDQGTLGRAGERLGVSR